MRRAVHPLKENLLWVRTFRTVKELRPALINFKQIYNECWLIERHGHQLPAQLRRDQMDNLPLAALSQSGVSEFRFGTHPIVPAVHFVFSIHNFLSLRKKSSQKGTRYWRTDDATAGEIVTPAEAITVGDCNSGQV